MTEQSVWDSPAAQVGGDFTTFTQPGDTISGKIVEVRLGTDFAGNPAPELVIDTAEGEKIVTAGQVRLKVALAEARPAVGDAITITMTQLENRPGGRTLKHFQVEVNGTKAESPAATQAAPAASAPVGQTPEQAAALANLTPEQKAALGL